MVKRLEEMDILRVIGCIAVIIIHVTASTLGRYQSHSMHLKLAYIINNYSKFAVPLFIFISGFVFFYVQSEKQLYYLNFMKKKLISIGVPYLIWNIVYFLFFVDKGIYPKSAVFFINNLFLGTMMYHMYFVIIIFQFYILSGLLLFMLKRCNLHILLILSAVINFISMKFFYFQYRDRFFISYFFFFILGCYLAKMKGHFIDVLYKIRIIVYGVALASGGVYTYELYQSNVNGVKPVISINLLWYIYSTLAIVSLYLFSITCTKKYSKFIKTLKPVGDASYYIYLSHPMFLIWSKYIISYLGLYSISLETGFDLFFVSIVSIGLGVSYINIKKLLKDRLIQKGRPATS